jgi:hypothetical protein
MDMSGAFRHIDFAESEVKECLSKLSKHDPPVIRPLVDNINDNTNNIRFIIADDLFREFIEDVYAGLFSFVPDRMRETWLFIRWPKPDSDEVKWYISLFGKKRTASFVNRALKNRRELEKKNDIQRNALIKYISDDRIKMYDDYTKHWYKEIITAEKYDRIHRQYEDIIDPIAGSCISKIFAKATQKQ